MNWEFANPAWNVLIALVSAATAIASAFAAFASRKTSEKTLQLQERQYLFESLKACAERANEYAKGKRGAEWGVNDAANIIRSLGLAIEAIKNSSQLKEAIDVGQLKKYFMTLLCMELFEEVHNGDAPDAVFQKTEPTRIADDVWRQWREVVEFFDIWDYSIATDEDLED
ncbi:MAG TPA: hypothetical protein VGI71_21770 [Scandinavium sp.]|jgi:hypothetical protein